MCAISWPWALWRASVFSAALNAAEQVRVGAAIETVGLVGFESRTLETLSGGQMQRALFARLIVQDQPVILLDEPFGAIDAATIDDLLALIARWRAEGRTVVAVLHELDIVRRAFPRTLLLARECIFWGDTRDALCEKNLVRARAMSEAFDERARECLRDEFDAEDRCMFTDVFVTPFADYEFMRRALVGSLALALSGAPLGVFLILRRMSLAGDALSHAILPGAAVGYLVAGLSLPAMTFGGLFAGLVVALAAGAASRFTTLREDASLAAFYLVSLALGVTLVSLRGSNVDLLHVLFGSVVGLDDAALLLLVGVSTVTLVLLAVFYRALVLDTLDPLFLRQTSAFGEFTPFLFLALVVLNLVAGFHALGTLMAVGVMMLPAAAARLWTRDLAVALPLAAAIGALCCYGGLVFSNETSAPTGPAIILAAGVVYFFSMIFGRAGGVLRLKRPRRHLEG